MAYKIIGKTDWGTEVCTNVRGVKSLEWLTDSRISHIYAKGKRVMVFIENFAIEIVVEEVYKIYPEDGNSCVILVK